MTASLFVAAPGCSSDAPDDASGKVAVKYQTVLSSPWSTSPASFAHQDAYDALPDGPRSFSVDRTGAVHVLDAIKRRIAVYSKGKLQRFLTLPNEDFVDFDFDPSGGYVMLDTMDHGEIVLVDAKGKVTKRVKLEGSGIEDAKLVTGVAREATGIWVQQHHAVWLLVADGDGEPVQQRVKRRGKAVSKDGHMLQVALSPPTGLVVRKLNPDGTDKSIPVNAGANVAAITGVEQDKVGNVYVGLWNIKPGSGSSPSQEKHSLAVIAPNGKLLRYDALPKLGPTQNSTRILRKGQDGHMYILVVGSRGITVSRYTP